MLTWYEQEYRTSCVAACLRMVLSGFGQQPAEKALRQALRIPPVGISLNDTAERLEQLGVSFELHADWSLLDLRDCLREGWFPIVGIQRRFFGHPDAAHAVVVVAISKQTISILDPLGKAKPEPLRLTTFELAWRAARHQALIIQSPFPL